MLPLYEKIDSLCKSRGTNVTKMCKEAGVSRSILSDYKAGRSKTISVDNIQKIADFFEVTLDYLLGNEQKEKPALFKDEPEITFDDFTYAFLDETKELTEENKEKLLEMAKFFKMQQEKENSDLK